MPAAVADAARPVALWRDPVLVALAVAGAVLVGGFALGVGGPRVQLVVCWTVMPILDILLFQMSRRVCRTLYLPPEVRRFWRAIAAAALIFLAGDLTQTVVVLADPSLDRLVFHPVQATSAMIGVSVVCGIALIHPTGAWSRGQRHRLLLDVAIVNCASASVVWCLMTRPNLVAAGTTAAVTAMVGCGLMFCAVLLAVKLLLSGRSPAVAAAAVPIAAAAVVQALGSALLPSGSAGDLGMQLIMLVAPCLLLPAAPRIQLLRGRSGTAENDRSARRRRYSVLPYAATVICAITLIAALVSGGLGLPAWGALVGLLVNVALVVARQVLALAENNRLLERLDQRERRLESLLRQASEMHERLSFQAGHDDLTGLANRRRFTAAMRAADGDAAVLLIDLDGFKQINDTYGHAAGDAVLRHVAGLLLECAGPDDVAARLGGDEFAVLIGGGDETAAERLAARIRTALAQPAEVAGRRLTVGASIGAARGPASDPDHLLNAADLRMYDEKQRSRAVAS